MGAFSYRVDVTPNASDKPPKIALYYIINNSLNLNYAIYHIDELP